jgi:copper chaperone
MIAYRIEDMHCGGCVRAIGAAVSRVSPTATLQADVEARLLRVDAGDDAAGIEAAIRAAGFDPVRIESDASGGAAGSDKHGGG